MQFQKVSTTFFRLFEAEILEKAKNIEALAPKWAFLQKQNETRVYMPHCRFCDRQVLF